MEMIAVALDIFPENESNVIMEQVVLLSATLLCVNAYAIEYKYAFIIL